VASPFERQGCLRSCGGAECLGERFQLLLVVIFCTSSGRVSDMPDISSLCGRIVVLLKKLREGLPIGGVLEDLAAKFPAQLIE